MKYAQLDTLTSDQKALLSTLTQLLTSQTGQGVESYPGTYTAGESETQSNLFDYISSMFGSSDSSSPLNVLSSILEPYDKTAAEEYYQDALVKPSMDLWENTIKPSVMETYASMDSTDSSGSRNALAKAGTSLDLGLSSELADLLYKGQNTKTTNQLSALSNLNSLLSGLNTIGTTQRNITSEQLYEPYQDWSTEQSYNNPWLNLLSTSLGTKAFENIVQSQSGSSSSGLGKLLGSGLSGLGSLLGGISSFL